MDTFTDRELEIISNGLLCLIENAGRAKGLVLDTDSQNSIDDYIRTLQTFNLKVCNIGRNEKLTEDHIVHNVTMEEMQILIDKGIDHYPVNDDITEISIVGDHSYFKNALYAIGRI